MPPAARKILLTNGIIWLVLAIAAFSAISSGRYNSAIALLFLIGCQAVICLLLGLFMVFTSSREEGKGMLLSGLMVGLLTFLTCGGFFTLS